MFKAIARLFVLVPILSCRLLVFADPDLRNEIGIRWVDCCDEWGRPWGDCGSDFYGRLDAQRRHLAAQGISPEKMEFAVGTEISLRKVFRPKIWFKGDFSGEVSLSAAHGEAEAFQLVICPLAESERTLTQLGEEKRHGESTLQNHTVTIDKIEVTPLVHASGKHEIGPEHVQLHRVGYVKTVQPQYPVMHIGEWPDPLLPMKSFSVANPFAQPIWVEIRVPPVPAGDYRGSITVKGPHDVRIQVRLKVWNFKLPELPRAVTMGWSLNGWFKKDGIQVLLKRLDALLDDRLAPWHVAYEYHNDLEKHDRVMQLLLQRGVKLQAMSGKPPPEFVAHLREKGWLKHYICLWGDEPHERDYPTYRQRKEEIHAAYPGLTVAMTEEPQPNNVNLFDLYIAEPSAQNDLWVQEALGRGDRVWWYLCQLPIHAQYSGPIHRCPGMIVDRPAIDHRITYWLAFKQGIEGVSYWAVSAWPAGFEKWPAEPWPVSPRLKFPYSGQHNANGFLCYPGPDGHPWPSIRLKCMRDGLEDQEYLMLLRDRAGPTPTARVQRLLQIPTEVAHGLRYYNKDPQALLQARQEIAEEILRSSTR